MTAHWPPGIRLTLRHPDPVSFINSSLHRFDRLRIGRADDEFVPGGCPLFGLAPAEALTLEFFHPGSNGGEIVGSAHRDFLPSVLRRQRTLSGLVSEAWSRP